MMTRTALTLTALLVTSAAAPAQTPPTATYTERGVISSLRVSGFGPNSGETFISLQNVVAQNCGLPGVFEFVARIGYPPQGGGLERYLSWHQTLLRASIKGTPISVTYFCGPNAEVISLHDLGAKRSSK